MITRILILSLLVALAFADPCKLSIDCKDSEGRTLCYQSECQRDVPCNKDNDCFFYGAADLASGQFHPACFKTNLVGSKPGYGICLVTEVVQHTDEGLSRLPGADVEGVLIKP